MKEVKVHLSKEEDLKELKALENILVNGLVDQVGEKEKIGLLPSHLLLLGYIGDPIFNMNVYHGRLLEKKESLHSDMINRISYKLTQSNLPLYFTEYYSKVTRLILSQLPQLTLIDHVEFLEENNGYIFKVKIKDI